MRATTGLLSLGDMDMKDTHVTICNSATLTIKETRQSSTLYSNKDGFKEVTKNTNTLFHWKITTIASKIDVDDLNDTNIKEQELYNVTFKSHGYDHTFGGFKTRENAIKNALDFADRNEIELDGYTL